MLEPYNCLVLRLRMPVSDDLHRRSFVTKIANYPKIVNVPNSHTLLYELLPAAVALAQHSETGVYNLTNPGAASHNEVLECLKKHVMPSLTWTNFTVEEQAKVIKVERSNCKLDSSKLVNKLAEYGMRVHEIYEAYELCFQRMARNMGITNEKRQSSAIQAIHTDSGIPI